MGIDVHAFMEHRLTRDEVANVPDCLRRFDPLIEELRELFGSQGIDWSDSFPPPESSLATSFRERLWLYCHADGVGLAVGHRSLKFSHVCRWHRFSTDPIAAAHVQRFARAVAGWARTDTILYLPEDSLVDPFQAAFDGLTEKDVTRQLLKMAGPPAPIIQATSDPGTRHFVEHIS